MIVTEQRSNLRIITQNDHAHFSAELLRLWRHDGLPAHPRRAQLLFAAREHDNGWLETDSAPWRDPETGWPHSFLSLPRAERWRVWRRGVERFVEREPHSSLLIVEHALSLHREHREDPGWEEIFTFWDELRQRLLEETGISEADLAADYRWIDLTDLLSLVACSDWREPRSRAGFGCRFDGESLYVDPFPLAGSTVFEIQCRTIPARHYVDLPELAVELATARWRLLSVRVAPEPRRGIAGVG